MGEYIISMEDVSKGAVHQRLDNSAWQVTASYVLTGEKASYTGVVPENPFNPLDGRWGAFELAARVGQLDVDSDAFANYGTAAKSDYLADSTKSASEAMNWGVGLNWYLNRDVKLMLDYDQTKFKGGAAQGDRPDEHALFSPDADFVLAADFGRARRLLNKVNTELPGPSAQGELQRAVSVRTSYGSKRP